TSPSRAPSPPLPPPARRIPNFRLLNGLPHRYWRRPVRDILLPGETRVGVRLPGRTVAGSCRPPYRPGTGGRARLPPPTRRDMNRKRSTATALVVLLAAGVLPAAAQAPVALDSAFLAGFRWRSIGPANMSGRVTDIEGLPSPSKTFYFAAATGGIWKTTNNGVTFTPVFDRERVISMGDLAIAPSDSLTLWAGTGEEDSRNSISPGGGIYKSTDGGASWQLMGLEQTQAIGRIVVHPTDKNIVYVAAL